MPSEPLLRFEMTHRQGPIHLRLAFTLTHPWTILFGASGSGKTTVLRSIAGFLRPQRGRITLADTVLFDATTQTSLPAHLRPLRSAAQTARLFPHMTVLDNLRWGMAKLQNRGDLAHQVLELFRLSPLAALHPEALSGGERQRVSVARAVTSAAASACPLLLLDEPFTGLDFTLRDALAVDLRDWLLPRGIAVLSVTHDIAEAFLLDAEVLRIHDGQIADRGPAHRVLALERESLLRQLRG